MKLIHITVSRFQPTTARSPRVSSTMLVRS